MAKYQIWRIGIVAFLGVLGVPACGSDDTDAGVPREDERDRASESVVLEPGASIADGFVVAEGTTVPGGAFPTPGMTYSGDPSTRSWVAVIQTELELPEVLASYAQQVVDLGYRVPGFSDGVDAAAAAETGCSANLAQDNSDQPQLPPQPPVGTPLFVSCSVAGEKVVDGQLELVDFRSERSYPAMAEQPVDIAVLTLTRRPASAGTTPTLRDVTELDAQELGRLPAPPPVSTVPEVTEGGTPVGWSSVQIEPGTRVLGIGFNCSWGGFEVVTEVTGDPDEVFDAYVAQLGAIPGYNPPVKIAEPSEFDGRAVRSAAIWGDDSSYVRLTMLAGRNAPALLLISHLSG